MTAAVGSTPLRVLHAVARMDRGGIETFLMRIYRHLDRSLIQFDFLVHKTEPGAYDNEITEMGGRIHPIRFSYDPLALPAYVRDLKTFFQTHSEYRITHAHLNAFNGIFAEVAKHAGVPIRIGHIHAQSSGSALREPLWNLIKRVGRKSFTECFACSQEAGLWAYGPSITFSVIQNGVPLDMFRFDQKAREIIRQKYGLDGRLVIGHIGAFCRGKNQSFLLDVLTEIRKQKDKVVLFLVGEGGEQESFRARAEKLGLVPHVFFAGEVSVTNEYLSAMDVFAFPSINEGLGIAAIEAQASGLPCVLSTGVPEEAAATELAMRLPLRNNNNVVEWAHAILDLAERKQDRLQIRQGLESFHISGIASLLQQAYLAALMSKELR